MGITGAITNLHVSDNLKKMDLSVWIFFVSTVDRWGGVFEIL